MKNALITFKAKLVNSVIQPFAKQTTIQGSMASVNIPARSISLPSRPHPNSVKLEAELAKLKTWESSSASSNRFSGAEDIQAGLVMLAELFNCIQEFIQSPITQQAFQHQHSYMVEKALDGSVGLLDVCSSARDLLLSMKGHVQDLQSAFRRRGVNSCIESNILAYISFRKKAKKDINKSLQELKRLENNVESFLLDIEHHLFFVLSMIREARIKAICIFQSLVLFLAAPLTARNTNGWSIIISKVIRSGSSAKASRKTQKVFNEVENVDVALLCINGRIRKGDAKVELQEVQGRLETLNVSMRGLEAKIDCMFRCLIQNRVSLLNLVAF
ncbi:hypothetical protein K2173_005991 [Erythroxylum novogranatense]|uniref:DUF241 domain protein n=1 Tax=Erythroxylum novogranatense TaxID=1862640 RepID=A0AAV8TCY4_9ROSI|nr:hypothetical protein K2173_005991 [Erythroxylum novogranatense]